MKTSILVLLPFLAACGFFTAPEDGLVPIDPSSAATHPASQHVMRSGRVSSPVLDVGVEALIEEIDPGGATTVYGTVCKLSIVVVTTSSFHASTSPTQALPGRFRPVDNSEPGSHRFLSAGESPLSKGIGRTLFSKTG